MLTSLSNGLRWDEPKLKSCWLDGEVFLFIPPLPGVPLPLPLPPLDFNKLFICCIDITDVPPELGDIFVLSTFILSKYLQKKKKVIKS